MTGPLFTAICVAAVASGTTILIPALGQVLAERSGVLNLGVDGMMLIAALFSDIVAIYTSNVWLALAAGIVAGMALALVHAFLSISLRANQAVSGLSIIFFSLGFTGFVGKPFVGVLPPHLISRYAIPGLSKLPFIGQVLFNQDPVVYFSFVLTPALWYFIYHTRPGFNLRTIGENPATADAMGVAVASRRYAFSLVGGALAGVGGVYLALFFTPGWVDGMTAGRGWIALGLVAFGIWDPFRAMAGAYLFGFVDGFQLRMQGLGTEISPFFLNMLPYLFIVLVLALSSGERLKRRLGVPRALAQPYWREERT